MMGYNKPGQTAYPGIGGGGGANDKTPKAKCDKCGDTFSNGGALAKHKNTKGKCKG